MGKVLRRDLYEDDFFAWTRMQAKELRRFARTRPNLPLDLEHLAEEIADLGQEQRNALPRIESRRAKSITDLAEQEGVTDAYVCRLLPLTCLAPDIVEAILDGGSQRG